jgi:sterol 3beta-glucosyltransferase
MKIAICTIGSRGDVQPFLILGNYLAQRGHEVKFASAEMYRSLAEHLNVEYVAFEGDYEKLTSDEAMKEVVGKNPFTIQKNLKEKVYPIIENSIDTFYEVSQWADAIVYHPKSLVDCFGFQFPEKLMKAYVVPAFSPTKEFHVPIFSFPIPAFLNKSTYQLANSLISTVKTPVNNFKAKHNIKGKFKFIKTPTIYGISPSFLPQPKDYPIGHHFTGFWFDKTVTRTLSAEVKSFMNGDKKKLVLTFGSMPYKSKVDINDFINGILSENDIKILVVRGWGLKDANIEESENVKAVDKSPFDQLFPLADAVIHHGGAGTTAIALKSGVPMMICPVLHPVGDQMFWGKQVQQLGVGVQPIPLSSLKVSQLTRSVKKLMHQDFSAKTQRLKAKIEQEDGLKRATELIEAHFLK